MNKSFIKLMYVSWSHEKLLETEAVDIHQSSLRGGSQLSLTVISTWRYGTWSHQ